MYNHHITQYYLHIGNMRFLLVIIGFMSIAVMAVGGQVQQPARQRPSKNELAQNVIKKFGKLNEELRRLAEDSETVKALQMKDFKKIVKMVNKVRKVVGNIAKKADRRRPPRVMSDPCQFFTEFSVMEGTDSNDSSTIDFSIRSNSSDRECNMAKTWVRVYNKTSGAPAHFRQLLQLCPPRIGCDVELGDYAVNASLPTQEGSRANLSVSANYSGSCNDVSGRGQIIEVKRCSGQENDFVFHLPDSCGSRDFCASSWDPDRPTRQPNTTVTTQVHATGGARSTTTSAAGGGGGGQVGK